MGRIVRTHGLRGEVAVGASALEAGDFGAIGEVALVGADGSAVRRLRVRAARGAGSHLLVTFAGIEDVSAASELRGLWIEADRGSLPDAGPGHVYHHDLIGLEVFDRTGRSLGCVRRVLVTGANEVLEVGGSAGEILIPYHPGTIVGWDPASGRLDVDLPEGLEEVYRERSPERD